MRKIVLTIFCIYLLPITSFAADSMLSLRMESLQERDSVYTSVTDMYELDILTPESTQREQDYRAYTDIMHQEVISSLFGGTAPQPLSNSEYTLNKTTEIGLFLNNNAEEIYLPQQDNTANISLSIPLVVSLIILLCIAAFWFSNWWHKKKKGGI